MKRSRKRGAGKHQQELGLFSSKDLGTFPVDRGGKGEGGATTLEIDIRPSLLYLPQCSLLLFIVQRVPSMENYNTHTHTHFNLGGGLSLLGYYRYGSEVRPPRVWDVW
eukprot:TRINITY_DN38716_c0_g1_i1.p1 TRINITY_DN38716_c0_g1~~TRINITY_DN38716_c0_g1_i1.p1  ORF type:complete len:108 (-),score=2.03 TRINITY_DN38716_c0_g1_i1:51-374(-)